MEPAVYLWILDNLVIYQIIVFIGIFSVAYQFKGINFIPLVLFLTIFFGDSAPLTTPEDIVSLNYSIEILITVLVGCFALSIKRVPKYLLPIYFIFVYLILSTPVVPQRCDKHECTKCDLMIFLNKPLEDNYMLCDLINGTQIKVNIEEPGNVPILMRRGNLDLVYTVNSIYKPYQECNDIDKIHNCKIALYIMLVSLTAFFIIAPF